MTEIQTSEMVAYLRMDPGDDYLVQVADRLEAMGRVCKVAIDALEKIGSGEPNAERIAMRALMQSAIIVGPGKPVVEPTYGDDGCSRKGCVGPRHAGTAFCARHQSFQDPD